MWALPAAVQSERRLHRLFHRLLLSLQLRVLRQRPHCLPNGKTAVKRAVVKATHNMTLFWKYEQHSQYISGDILPVFLFPTHYFKSEDVYFCNAKEFVDKILIWYANSKQLFPVKLGLLLTASLACQVAANCL